ncbi:MAG TPA: sugar ABC transporter ATP-binding protein [Firmicutes bacterium]|nr:sugar ABC transporter ATP-binding protein [Bacillota bacterium]
MAEPLLRMRDIKKQFYGNYVLKGVNLDVYPGEIHALLGENGAGKSTLMNVLFGMPVIKETGGFEGTILWDGQPMSITSPRQAVDLGIGMVHQEFMLLPGFTVAENIKLGREPLRDTLLTRWLGTRLSRVDQDKMRTDARAALDRLEVSLDEWAPVAGMPVGYKQFVEIAREIDKTNVRLLVLDEPTAVLTESEAELLLQAMQRLAAKGISILFITHRLDEVKAVANRITVLRDGEVAGLLDAEKASLVEMAQLMVGRKIEAADLPPRTKPLSGEDMLTINNLEVDMPGERVNGLNLTIKRGEILGIGGLAGHGKIGIANGIMGLYSAQGSVYLNKDKMPLGNSLWALRHGLAFVSEDRRGVGLLLDEPISINIILTAMQAQGKFLRHLPGNIQMRNDREIEKFAREMISALDIRCTGPHQLARRLSGGNQQKVCIARAMALEPDLLFVSEPTRGIDVGAKRLVLDQLVKINREQGVTVVITSSELAELRQVADRVAIIYGGKLAGILPPTASDAEFGLLMAGKGKEAVGL